MILLQVVEGLIQAPRHRANLRRFLGLEIVQILLSRLSRVDLVLDPVQSGHQHGRKRQIRIGRWIREAHFDPLRLRAWRIHGNPNTSRPVPARIGQQHRGFKAGRQPLIGVRRGVGEGRQGRSMLQDAADVMQAHLRHAGIFFSGKQRLPFLPDALVGVHARSVIAENRLRHEGHRLAVPPRHVLDDVLEHHHLVRGSQQAIKTDIDFRLACRGHFVVMFLSSDARLFHFENHFRADVLLRVGRRNREVPFLLSDLAAQVHALLPHVPHALVGINVVVGAVVRLVVPRMIEDEKLGFRPPVGGVADLGALEIFLRLLGDVSRIAIVHFTRDRIDDIADEAQGGHRTKRIHAGGCRVRHEQHVAVVDGSPAANRRPVEPGAVLEQAFRQFTHGNRKMLPGADQVHKLHVHDLDLILLCKI